MKKSLLYVVPGLNPLLKDGASNRVDSFAKCFWQNGYKVHIAALCHPGHYMEIMKGRRALDARYRWIIIPYLFSFSSPFNPVAILPVRICLLFLALFYRCRFVLADYQHGAKVALWTKICAELIVNHRGDSIDEAMMLRGEDENSAIVSGMHKCLSQSVAYADYNVCVSRNLKNKIENRTGKIVTDCFIFPCCADIVRFENVSVEGRGPEITIGYFGSLSKWQCFDKVVCLYKQLKSMDARYRLVVLTGSRWDEYEEALNEAGDFAIESVSFEEMPRRIAMMDVSIALRESRPLNIVSSPTKLSESLAAGVPVIVTKATGDYAEIIRDGETGLVLEDPQITEEALERIHNFCMEVKNNRERVGQACRAAVRERTWNRYSQEFVNFIENR